MAAPERGLAHALLESLLHFVVLATLLAAGLGLSARHSRPSRAPLVPRSRPSTFPTDRTPSEGSVMLYTFAIVMILLWLLGLLSSYTMGGFIHILLVVAVVVLLVRLISGRKAINL